MDSFIRFEDTLLLEYDATRDCYTISYDSGSSFPYELYETVEVLGNEYYIIYLESTDDVPVASKDVWIALDSVLEFVDSYPSQTDLGKESMKQLHAVLDNALKAL